MTLLDRSDTFHEGSTLVLETERLRLRAPRLEDAKAIAVLVNDRRIAENTFRIPHPYSLADAKEWIGSVTRRAAKRVFVITVAGEIIGGCGCHHHRDGVPEIGYWLGVPFWGNGYATEAARALIDHVFDDPRACDARGRRPRQQSGVAPGAGEVRLPVDRRRALSHPRHPLVGAVRSLPSRAGDLGLAQELGPRACEAQTARLTNLFG